MAAKLRDPVVQGHPVQRFVVLLHLLSSVFVVVVVVGSRKILLPVRSAGRVCLTRGNVSSYREGRQGNL